MDADGDERGRRGGPTRAAARVCTAPPRTKTAIAERRAKVAGGEVVRLKPRRASSTVRRSASGKRRDLVLDEPAGADEEEDHHRLREEREQHRRDRVGDVPVTSSRAAGCGRGQVRGEREALDGGQEEAGESEERAGQERHRHARQSLPQPSVRARGSLTGPEGRDRIGRGGRTMAERAAHAVRHLLDRGGEREAESPDLQGRRRVEVDLGRGLRLHGPGPLARPERPRRPAGRPRRDPLGEPARSGRWRTTRSSARAPGRCRSTRRFRPARSRRS